VITRRQLVAALARRDVSDWVVIERAQELATLDDARSLRRNDTRTRWTIIVHHDVPHGRGSARLDLSTLDDSANDVVTQALSIAEAAIGPAWQSTSPAAPAKVALLDPLLDKTNLEAVASELVATVHHPEGATVATLLELVRERVVVQARSGFHTAWTASSVRAESLITVGERSLEITRDARRIADLELDAALAAAAADLAVLPAAAPPTPGRTAVILGPEALLASAGGGVGMWRVFADYANADVARTGLTRYHLGAPIAAGADQLAEPLTITSDGALDWGTSSAPVGDEGDAVRRFPLIERGIAVGLGMSMHEAARRRTDPNGGVRNLVVAPGTWTDALPAGRTIEVRRLRSLAIDPHTGAATLDLALSIDRATNQAFAGGTLRIDLVTALARARRSATTFRRGAYVGPTSVLIEGAELLA